MLGFIQNRLLTNKSTVTGLRRSSTIKIPPRIERGPTDILKALSGTVKPEPGNLAYKVPDGGIFNPTSPYLKRVTALAMESGRKAAKFVVEEYPRVFSHEISEPFIKAYSPPIKPDEISEVSEADLLKFISDTNVGLAMKAYTLLKEKNIEVTETTKQLLLELVCFYNSSDKPDNNLLETQYYKNTMEKSYNTWVKDGFAETLFKEMEKNWGSYSALILGMLKHGNVFDGTQMYEEACKAGVQFPVEVYNQLLGNVSSSYGEEERYKYILDMFKTMKENSVPPNLGTLNATLSTIASMRTWHRSRQFSMDVLHEFKNIGIHPSLGTYYHLLEIFFNRRNEASIFADILDEIDPSNLTLQHCDDLKFFTKAMMICAHNLKDSKMADRVHSILCTGNNLNFLCGNLREHFYYRSYLIAYFHGNDPDEAMKLFYQIVPTLHSVDSSAMMIILSCLEEKKAYKYYPAIWKAAKDMNVHQYGKTIEILMRGIAHNLVEKMEMDENEIRPLAEDLWKNSRLAKTVKTMEMPFYSDALIVFSRLGDFEKATNIFEESTILSYCELSYEALSSYLTECIAAGNYKNAVKCIQLAHQNEFETAELVARLKKHPEIVDKLSASQKKWISNAMVKSKRKEKRMQTMSDTSESTDSSDSSDDEKP